MFYENVITNKRIESEFNQNVIKHCMEMNYTRCSLTEQMHQQLTWYIADSIITPQADAKRSTQEFLKTPSAQLSFEVERCLKKINSLECLLAGKDAYEEFVQGQNDDIKLSFENFIELSQMFQNFPEDLIDALKAICFFTKTDRAEAILRKAEIINEVNPELWQDSEAFLTTTAKALNADPSLQFNFPIFNSLNADAIDWLNAVYWPKFHFRHLLFTEGGVGMTKSFKEGVENFKFTMQDFYAWYGRWILDACAFGIGKNPKYFDQHSCNLYQNIANELLRIFNDPRHEFLDKYLLDRSEFLNNRPDLSELQLKFFGHIAAFFDKITISTKEHWDAILLGATDYGDLPKLYEIFCNDENAVTPTYVPAILNNAFLYFTNQNYNTTDSIAYSTSILCEVLRHLYKQPRDQLISCRDFANMNNLTNLLNKDIKASSLHLEINNGALINIKEDFKPSLQRRTTQ